MKAISLLALLLAAPASAQTLVDPMRPPMGRYADTEAVAASSGGPVLEQVVLSDRRRFAVINGRRVALGDKFGDATLVQIAPDQVTLKGDTTQVLRMFPNAGKKGGGDGALPPRRKAEEGS